LVLAIALSVALVALIGTAIDLYLTQVDSSRTEVEEAQLARSILAMIADDIRAATIYQPQDTSSIAQLLASTSSFDVDAIDDARQGGSGGGGASGGTGTTSGSGSFGSSTSGGGSLGGLSSGMSSTGGVATVESEMPLGLNGTIDELYVDATRLPRQEELFGTVTGYTNAPTGIEAGTLGAGATPTSLDGIARPSDLKSVRYFVRPGEVVPPGSAAATSLSPDEQLRGGGLVRQEIPRSTRLWAEQSGNTAVLDSGQALVASEVVHIEFRYFDGTQVTEFWEMLEKNCLPVAVEVSLWLAPLDAEDTSVAGRFDSTNLANTAREYRQTIFLPMSALSSSGGQSMSGMSGSSSQSGSASGSGSGGSSGSASGGSSFGGSQSGF
jgi:uncharacterized membrane protein YgcG